ncbi:hypothetical protein niasHT_036016 [Heterodera trifolii]|uniref:Uncharacterized protein n=1 Tax=Heterodera trifolii TaxID=157864 RepID=A0ABD2ICQ0_9BILA
MVVVPFLRYCGWKTEQISLRGARPSGFKCLLALVLGIERTGDAEIKVGGGVGIRATTCSVAFAPMRTLALNGVVSAETIRLNETAVIAALGNAR